MADFLTPNPPKPKKRRSLFPLTTAETADSLSGDLRTMSQSISSHAATPTPAPPTTNNFMRPHNEIHVAQLTCEDDIHNLEGHISSLFKCAPGVPYKGLFSAAYLSLRMTMLRRVNATDASTGPYYYLSCVLEGGLQVNYESRHGENIASLRWSTKCVYPETRMELNVVGNA